MFNVITDEQKREIETLMPEHRDALIGYGGQMHRDGIIRGMLMMAGVDLLVSAANSIYKHFKSKKQ